VLQFSHYYDAGLILIYIRTLCCRQRWSLRLGLWCTG